MKFKQILAEKTGLPPDALPSSYQVLGNILLLKLFNKKALANKKKIGSAVLKIFPYLKSVCLQKGVSGELRKPRTETIAGKENFHSNTANQSLDSVRGLADKVTNLSRALSDRGVQAKQISVLKPETTDANFGSVLALKSSAPYPIFMMLYLIQTEGSLANDLLGVLNYDQKTGDYFVILDEELAKLLAERLGAKALAKAA